MSAVQTAEQLAAFEGRGAGTDAERRAALWLAAQLRSPRIGVRVDPFWGRPNWGLAHAWHALLAVAGSLVSVSSPRIGGAILLLALLSVIADERLGISPGRRLTPERASQNVVATQIATPATPGTATPGTPATPGTATPGTAGTAGTAGTPETQAPQVHLIITANYDAGRTGLVYRDFARAPFARAGAALGRRRAGWLGWMVIAIAWLLAIAILRLDGDRGTAIGVVQLIPTAGLVIALALLLELGSSGFGPSANDNASGVGVAVALARALAAAPPSRATVELVLAGAGDGFGLGFRRYVRARKRQLTAENAIVLGIAPCAAGQLRWWISDGQLVALRYFDRLAKMSRAIAGEHPELNATPHRGRGATPAFRAASARRPAIGIGRLDETGRIPSSHQQTDTADRLDPRAIDATLEFALLLSDAIDEFLREQPSGRGHRISLRRPLPVLAGGEREPADQLRP